MNAAGAALSAETSRGGLKQGKNDERFASRMLELLGDCSVPLFQTRRIGEESAP